MKDFFKELFKVLGVDTTSANDNLVTISQVNNSLFLEGMMACIIPLIFFFLFYFIINSSKFCQWYHWVLTLFISSIVSFGVVFAIFTSKSSNFQSADFPAKLSHGMAAFVISFLVFIVVSFIGKWWSCNCRRTPF